MRRVCVMEMRSFPNSVAGRSGRVPGCPAPFSDARRKGKNCDALNNRAVRQKERPEHAARRSGRGVPGRGEESWTFREENL